MLILVADLGYGDIGPLGSTTNKTPQLDRALAVFTFDNAGATGKSMGPLRGGKGGAKYEGHMREPATARLPGTIPAGQTTDETVTAVDSLPSLAVLFGADPRRSPNRRRRRA